MSKQWLSWFDLDDEAGAFDIGNLGPVPTQLD